MHLAHMVGEHHFENQSQSVAHTLVSWAPFVIGMLLVLGIILFIVSKRQVLQLDRIKIRRK